jgi:hypothetical protein
MMTALPPRMPTALMPSAALAFGILVFVLVIGVTGQHLLADPDTQWHIAVGRWILEHGRVPTVDSHSQTFLGKPWIAKEWLSQVILALAYAAAGWNGVAVLAAGAVAITFSLMLRLLLRDLALLPALILAIAAIAMSSSHFLARPHVLAFPFMLLWTAGLVRAVEEKRTPSWRLLGALLAWANLHGGFTLGLVLVAAFALEAGVASPAGAVRRRTATAWTKFGVAATVTACLTPYGPESMLVTVRVLTLGEMLPAISEWQSPNFNKVPFHELLLLAGLFGLVAARVRVPLVRLLIVFGLLHLFLSHARNAELLATLAPLALAPCIARQWTVLGRTGPPPVARRATIGFSILAAALVGLGLARATAVTPPPGVLPAAALAFAQQSGVQGPVFNDYNFGGALILRGIPTFIDGRGELYGATFAKRYLAALYLRDGAQLGELLDEYGIQWTLLTNDRPANRVLERLPGWRRVYRDEIATAFERIPDR